MFLQYILQLRPRRRRRACFWAHNPSYGVERAAQFILMHLWQTRTRALIGLLLWWSKRYQKIQFTECDNHPLHAMLADSICKAVPQLGSGRRRHEPTPCARDGCSRNRTRARTCYCNQARAPQRAGGCAGADVCKPDVSSRQRADCDLIADMSCEASTRTGVALVARRPTAPGQLAWSAWLFSTTV